VAVDGFATERSQRWDSMQQSTPTMLERLLEYRYKETGLLIGQKGETIDSSIPS